MVYTNDILKRVSVSGWVVIDNQLAITPHIVSGWQYCKPLDSHEFLVLDPNTNDQLVVRHIKVPSSSPSGVK
jgi:hypothetical protein